MKIHVVGWVLEMFWMASSMAFNFAIIMFC